MKAVNRVKKTRTANIMAPLLERFISRLMELSMWHTYRKSICFITNSNRSRRIKPPKKWKSSKRKKQSLTIKWKDSFLLSIKLSFLYFSPFYCSIQASGKCSRLKFWARMRDIDRISNSRTLQDWETLRCK